MEASSPHSYIWEKSATPRRSGGLKICMPKNFQGDLFLEITLFTKGYILSISRFWPTDMLAFIEIPGFGPDQVTIIYCSTSDPFAWYD